MPNLITSLREALVADLLVEFPDAEVLSGVRSGKAVDKERLCVFWPGFGELGGRVVVGEARLHIRYWPVSPKVRDDAPSGVRDPGPLEQAAWDLAQLLQSKQTSYDATGAWFVRLVSCEPDYDPDEWGVEAIVSTMFSNPAVLETA